MSMSNNAAPSADDSDTTILLRALEERLRRDRKWIRYAEEFAPREGAEYVDGLRADVQRAREMCEAGDAAAALEALRGDEDDLLEDA